MRYENIKKCLILWWVFIFILTSIPGRALPDTGDLSIDKLVHVGMYGGLAFWLTLFWGKRGLRGIQLFFRVASISLLYSLFDEWHQPFVGRTFSLYDILSNMIGMVAVTIPVSLYFSRKMGSVRAD